MRRAWEAFRRSDAGIVSGLTVLALAIRAWGLTRQSIWVDESFSIVYAGIFDGMHLERILVNLHGPFHAILLFLWTRVFGTGEVALRSLEVVIGAATVPVLWWALRPLGRRSTALLAAGLLALSPFHLWYSQEIRNYVLLIFFAIVSTGAFARIFAGTLSSSRRARHPARTAGEGIASRRRPWALYTVAGVLGLLSNLAFSFLLVTQALFLALRGRSGRPHWRAAAISWTVIVLALTPWLAQFWTRHLEPSGALELRSVPAAERLRGETTAPILGIPFAYYAYSVGYSYGPSLRQLHEVHRTGLAPMLRDHWLALLWATLAFGAAGAIGIARLWGGGPLDRLWLLVLIVPILLTLATANRNLKVFNPRYAATAFPAWLLVLSEGIAGVRSRRGSFVLAVAVLVPTGVSIVQHQTVSSYWKEDAREVARLLHREAGEGDLLWVVGSEVPLRDYYFRRPGGAIPGLSMKLTRARSAVPHIEQFPRFEEAVAEHRRVFVLFLRPKEIDPDNEWQAYLERAHPESREVCGVGTRMRIVAGGRS